MTDDIPAEELPSRCTPSNVHLLNTGNLSRNEGESRHAVPVKNDKVYRGGCKIRSASYDILREGETTENYPRSHTWEEFFSDYLSDAKTERIYSNNISKTNQHEVYNHLGASETGKCTTFYPRRCMLAKSMSNFEKIGHKGVNLCKKCNRRRQEPKSQTVATASKKKMFNSVKTFAICLALLQLVQVMGSGYGKSALTSIERRYRLSTFSVGILQSCFHVGNLSVILFVSYYGSKWNRPRAIAIGSLLMAVSSFLSAMPQFVGSLYHVEVAGNLQDSTSGISASLYSSEAINIILNNTRRPASLVTENNQISPDGVFGSGNAHPDFLLSAKKSRTRLCISVSATGVSSGFSKKLDSPEGSETVDKLISRSDARYPAPKIAHLKANGKLKSDSIVDELFAEEDGTANNDSWNDSNLFIFIAVGSVLKGMGHSPLHPLGMSFVDDFATPRNSAVYIGIVTALSLLGPAFGFIMGSLTTGTWVDWGWVDTTKLRIGPHHPLWVGAWWIGYLVTAFLLLMATIPFWMFPRKIPKEKEDENDDVDDDACLGCFTLCSNFCIKENVSSDQSEKDPFRRDADDACLENETKNTCSCKITMKNDENAAKNNDLDRLRTESRRTYSRPNGLDFSENTSGTFDEAQAIQLITYLERPLRAKSGVRSGASPCEMPYSYSEMKFTSPMTHPMASSRTVKSASVHGEEHKRLQAQQRRSSSCFLKTNRKPREPNLPSSRRPSRLDKLALFDFSTSLKGLLSDTLFLSITLAFVCLTSFLAASVTYVSKYMETQFSVTASYANLLNGSVNLPMAVVGNLLGGWLIRRFNLDVRRTMAVVIAGLAMTIICVAGLLVFKCNQGSNLNYSIGADGGKCALPCNCGELFSPVCDARTNVTYRSPCHAGCTDVTSWKKTKVYSGCRCMHINQPGNGTISNSLPGGGILLPGPCHRPDCSKSHLPVFLGVMGTASLTAGLASTPSSLIILRIVPQAEKAFAIGIVFVFTRVLAWIPAPVYVGYVIDAACLRWSYIGGIMNRNEGKMEEERRNHCEVYDKDRLRKNFFAATGGLLVFSLLFYILALYLQTKKIREKKALERPKILSFDSPLISDKSPERTPTLTSPLRHQEVSMKAVTEKSLEMVELNENDKKDKNFNDFLPSEDKNLILSSALEAPRKLVSSVSAPTLAFHAYEAKLCRVSPPHIQKENIVRATVV